MDPSIETPGVEELTTPVGTTVDSTSTPGETPVTTPEQTPTDKQYVPLERFQEVNDRQKQTAAELATIKESLASLGTPPAADDLDPDVAKTLDSYMTRNGYVKKSELAQEAAKTQVSLDLAQMKTNHSLTDAEIQDLRSHATKIGAHDRSGLEAAYRDLYFDRIVEGQIKAALVKAGQPTPAAEAPSAGGAKSPVADAPKTGTSLMDRIKTAASK